MANIIEIIFVRILEKAKEKERQMTEENSPNDLLPTIVQLKIQPAADLSEDRVGECRSQYKSMISLTS